MNSFDCGLEKQDGVEDVFHDCHKTQEQERNSFDHGLENPDDIEDVFHESAALLWSRI